MLVKQVVVMHLLGIMIALTVAQLYATVSLTK